MSIKLSKLKSLAKKRRKEKGIKYTDALSEVCAEVYGAPYEEVLSKEYQLNTDEVVEVAISTFNKTIESIESLVGSQSLVNKDDISGKIRNGLFDIIKNTKILGINLVSNDFKPVNLTKSNEKQNYEDDLSLTKTNLISKLNHEILTPINCINLAVNLLKDTVDIDHESNKYVNIIEKSLNSLSEKADDLLTFKELYIENEEVNLDNFDLIDLITKEIEEVRDRNIQVNFQSNCQQYFIFSEFKLIKKLIRSSLSNAIMYSDGKPILITCDTSDQNYNYTLKIFDKGSGIPKESLARLLNSFEQLSNSDTRNFEGLGLGLTNISLICKKLDIEFTIDSTTKGTTLIFRSNKKELKENRISFVDQNSVLTILIVEDNLTNAKLLKLICNRLGHEVFHVNNGKEAVEIVDSKQFDIILMDIQMPVMNGFEATKIICSMNINVPIVACTTMSPVCNLGDMNDLGFSGLITKPIRYKEFKNKLCEAVLKHKKKI